MNKRKLRRLAGDWIKKAARFDVWSEATKKGSRDRAIYTSEARAMRFCAEQIMTLIRKPKS